MSEKNEINGSDSNCSICGSYVSSWEREAGLLSQTESGVLCISCLTERDPAAAKALLEKSIGPRLEPPPAEELPPPEDTPSGIRKLVYSPTACFLAGIACGALLVYFYFGLRFTGTPKQHYRPVSAETACYSPAQPGSSLSRTSIMKNTPENIPGSRIEPESHTVMSETGTGSSNAGDESESEASPKNFDKEDRAAAQLSELLEGFNEQPARMDELMQMMDNLDALSENYPGTRAASEAAAFRKNLRRRADILADGLLADRLRAARKYLSGKRFPEAAAQLTSAAEILERASTALRNKRRPLLDEISSELEKKRTGEAERVAGVGMAALRKGDYTAAEDCIVELIDEGGTIEKAKAGDLFRKYRETLQPAAVEQTRNRTAEIRRLSDAFKQFDAYLRSGDYAEAAAFARNFAVTREGVRQRREKEIFLTVEKYARILQGSGVYWKKIMDSQMSGKTITVTEKSGERYEGKLAGVEETDGGKLRLNLESRHALDADGKPVVMLINVEKLSTDTWAEFFSAAIGRLPEGLRQALLCRAAACGEARPAEIPKGTGRIFDFRRKLLEDAGRITTALEGLAELQVLTQHGEVKEARRKIDHLRAAAPGHPIELKLRLETMEALWELEAKTRRPTVDEPSAPGKE